MPKIWLEPERFDPMRFTEENSRARHRFAYAPFGGGAHMCLGLNFANMQAKCFTYHFLGTTQVSVAPGPFSPLRRPLLNCSAQFRSWSSCSRAGRRALPGFTRAAAVQGER